MFGEYGEIDSEDFPGTVGSVFDELDFIADAASANQFIPTITEVTGISSRVELDSAEVF